MTPAARNLLFWTPRVLSAALTLFLGLFAFDVFGEGRGLGETLLPFLIHLVPAAIVAVVLAVSWRREWIGGVVFVALAALYALWARGRLDWILLISGPLFAIGLLFLLGWRYRGEIRARS